jgi:fructosamine-3-kinase
MIPDGAREWLEYQGFGEVVSSRAVAGGCINHGMRILTTSGASFFLKTNAGAPEEMFEREVEGLEALRVPGAPRVPRPCVYAPSFLLMEDLSPAERKPDYWTVFGEQLATLHEHTGGRFGFDRDNYLGLTRQPNPWTEDGFEFFGQHRLVYQARLAHKQGYLDESELRMAERLASRLRDLVPQQPASLIHGDLWSGNAVSDEEGEPAIIDPAAHYGWAEAELAMTALFGGFPASFYSAYQNIRPLEPGYRERFPIYNLYHLLNHLNLFGEGYYEETAGLLKRYGK